MKIEKAAAARKEPEGIREKKVKETPVEGKEKKKRIDLGSYRKLARTTAKD